MSRLDQAYTDGCNWLAHHPWTTCLLLCASIIGATWFAGPVQ